MEEPTVSGCQSTKARILQPSPFLKMPTELIQNIAYLLPSDADRINLALCSSDFAPKILPAESHIWRRLFRDKYNEITKRTAVEYKIEYQIRAIVLLKSVDFGYGQRERETYWLGLLHNMIVEALCSSKGENKNYRCIEQILKNSTFLNRPMYGYLMGKPDAASELFCAIQLMCILSYSSSDEHETAVAVTYLALNPELPACCLQTDYDIYSVYGCAETDTELISEDLRVSTKIALDIRNFWLRHLLNEDENTFYASYMNLPKHLRPSAPVPLSCFCPYPPDPEDLQISQTCADLTGHMNEVEHITLRLEEHADPLNWPDLFDQHITSFRHPRDENLTLFCGTMTWHGSVQGAGAYGLWARICFAVYTPNEEVNFFDEPWPPANIFEDFDYLYSYEGVVSLGGSLMVGHWWDPIPGDGDEAKGPFIFWCT
ncbi:hypothetical protein BDW69DRAFT_205319 [Aspergillus filifer]